MKPAISVIMPVYNAEQYLVESVESILGQTFTDFEFIIINDGSNDKTLSILESYAAKDARVRLISRENRGLVATLNQGISLAQSALIARIDADDIALPNRFERQFEYLASHSDVVCLGSRVIIIDDAGRELTELDMPINDFDIQQLSLEGHTSICHPAVMYRKDAVKKVGMYREKFYPTEDLDLWLRLGEYGLLANLDVALTKYRFVSNSISGRLKQRQHEAAKASCQDAWVRRGVKGSFKATGDWRPSDTKESQFKFLLKFGWWAFQYGNRKAALIYGGKSIRLFPFSREGWRLLYCALFKGGTVG